MAIVDPQQVGIRIPKQYKIDCCMFNENNNVVSTIILCNEFIGVWLGRLEDIECASQEYCLNKKMSFMTRYISNFDGILVPKTHMFLVNMLLKIFTGLIAFFRYASRHHWTTGYFCENPQLLFVSSRCFCFPNWPRNGYKSQILGGSQPRVLTTSRASKVECTKLMILIFFNTGE
jgi:hypothetical protein